MRGVAGGGNVRWRLGSDGSSSLHAAAQQGHVATCLLLVHLSADPSWTNEGRQTPLDVAANRETQEFLMQLMRRKASGGAEATSRVAAASSQASKSDAGFSNDAEAKHSAP